MGAVETPRTVEIRVRADRLEDALASALGVVVAAAQGEELVPERGSLSVPFRGEAADLPGLLTELMSSLLGAVEGQGEAISAVSVAGVLSTDAGVTGWGFATVARGTAAVIRPARLSAPVLIARHGAEVEIGTTVTVGG